MQSPTLPTYPPQQPNCAPTGRPYSGAVVPYPSLAPHSSGRWLSYHLGTPGAQSCGNIQAGSQSLRFPHTQPSGSGDSGAHRIGGIWRGLEGSLVQVPAMVGVFNERVDKFLKKFVRKSQRPLQLFRRGSRNALSTVHAARSIRLSAVRTTNLSEKCRDLSAAGFDSTPTKCITKHGSTILQRFPVESILCDMDGTLLSSSHHVMQATIESVKDVISARIPFIPATGRSRKSAMMVTKHFLSAAYGIEQERMPGVYSQGLQVYGLNGQLIYERHLDSGVVNDVVQFCKARSIAVNACAGDQIVCTKRCAHTDKIVEYHDPLPDEFSEGIERLEELTGTRIHKLIAMAEESVLSTVRPSLTKALQGKATVTKAVPGMLEILPLGASKGAGVRVLLEHFGWDPNRVVAIGDGENDVEMLQHVGLGVAMGNGRDVVHGVADVITRTNDEDGVGEVLRQLLRGRLTL